MLFTGPDTRERWVTAGVHEITARQQGYMSDARRIAAVAGRIEELDLKLVTLSDAADTGRRWPTWVPWAVVAGGGAVAAAGGVLHALSFRNFNDYDQRFSRLDCARSLGCTPDQIGPELNAQLDRANREQRFAVASYLAGGTVIAAGVVLLYLNRPHLPEDAAPRSPGGGVAILPTISADAIGISLRASR
jgi:hypothetical protein